MNVSCLFTRTVDGVYQVISPDQALSSALTHLNERIVRKGGLASPADVRQLCALRLGSLEHEVFAVLFLDSKHRLIEFREMFRGTIAQTSVYPREVAKEALLLNAAAVIICHNHPSQDVTPSQADERLTATLKSALSLLDVNLLDHIIVGGGKTMSFAEAGLL